MATTMTMMATIVMMMMTTTVTMMTTVMISAVAGCGQALSPDLADANP